MHYILSCLVTITLTTSAVLAQRHSGASMHSLNGPPSVSARGVSPRVPMPANVSPQRAVTPRMVPLARSNRFPDPGFFRTLGAFGGLYGYPFYSLYSGYLEPNISTDYGAYDPGPFSAPHSIVPLPALPNDHPATALLTLQVPLGAEVWLQGKKVNAGVNWTFESPELKPHETFIFDVRVTWIEKGKQMEEKRTLSMRPGEHQSLQYLALSDKAVRVER